MHTTYIHTKAQPAIQGKVTMNYRQLQQALKTIRANGIKLNCKLNAKKVVLQSEYDRVTAKTETNTAKSTPVNSIAGTFAELFQIGVKDEVAKADDEILKLFSIEEIDQKIVDSISSEPTHTSEIAQATGFDEILVYRRVGSLVRKNLIKFASNYDRDDCYFIPKSA